MIKVYHIEYLFTGGERYLKTTSIDEFSRFLELAIDNEYCIQSTIKIYTEETKDG
jgi:hypothetical protein